MKIDETLIAYLEDLSYLTLSGGEKIRLKDDLTKILAYMESIGKLDTDGVPERSHPFDGVNAFREDTVAASADRALILANAPDKNGEMFIAPRTME